MDDQKREALEAIIRESVRLRDLARGSDSGFLAFLLEGVIHESRSQLLAAGHELPAEPAKMLRIEPR